MKRKFLLSFLLIASLILLGGCQDRTKQPDVDINFSVSPNGRGEVKANYDDFKLNDGVVLTAIPKEGYIFKNWTEDGNEISTNEVYKFRALTNRTLVANFVESFNLEVKFDPTEEAGKIEAEKAYEKNTEITIKATASYGYEFVKWVDENGNEVSKDKNYTFTITNDTVLTAVFEKVSPTESSQIITFVVIVVLIAGGIALTLALKKKRKVTAGNKTSE